MLLIGESLFNFRISIGYEKGKMKYLGIKIIFKRVLEF